MGNRESFRLIRSLWAYGKRHIKNIIMLTLFAVIFAVVFWLYQLPVQAVLYAALLCFALGGCFFAVGFLQFRARCRLLADMRSRVVFAVDELPAPRDEIELRYTELVEAVHRDKVEALTAADLSRADAMEYYTLWAHQIKTPIAAMRVLLTPEQAELKLELGKIEQYVEMALQYLRLESPSSDWLIEEVDLDDVVRKTLRKLSSAFIHKKLRLNYQPLHRKALSDEKWLGFVLEQVLSNAIKYTPTGSITIAMEEGERCTLLISDTGMGIRPEDVPRVFEKGYTGYNGRYDQKATGIGLYLCRRVMAKLSHTIAIRSVIGQGTTVAMDLSSEEMRHE